MSEDSKLGSFLRSRREAVTPDQLGLPTGTRRRAPGLRRAELAAVSGVSVDYLTRLEQGRDRHPSPQILAAIADALGLSSNDRILLRDLAKEASGSSLLCPGRTTPSEQDVRPSLLALLERMDTIPAVLLNRQTETLAHTSAYERLAGPTGLLDGSPPSWIRFVLVDPRAPEVFPEWDRVADEQVAALAAMTSGCSRTDPELTQLLDELTELAGDRFVERWQAPPTLPTRAGVYRLVHPEVGELRLAYETLDTDCERLISYLPADDASSAALDRLLRTSQTSQPTRLEQVARVEQANRVDYVEQRPAGVPQAVP